MSTLLEKVKVSLRIKTTIYDEEIGDLINAALADLNIVGVDDLSKEGDDKTFGKNVTNPLIIRAVTTYVKANFGTPEDAQRLTISYASQKDQLRLSSMFHQYPNNEGK